MASISGICSSSPTLKPQKPLLKATNSLRRDLVAFPTRPRLADRSLSVGPTQSVAREISAELSNTDDGIPKAEKKNKGLVKDPRALWTRYVDWLYQHKELGLFLDVSRIGFTDEFVAEMEPRFRAAFRAMEALEKGAIANPDEGRMVGHYWLRNSKLAPNSFLRLQIDKTLDSVCKFAEDVVSGKVSFSFTCPSRLRFSWQCLVYESVLSNRGFVLVKTAAMITTV